MYRLLEIGETILETDEFLEIGYSFRWMSLKRMSVVGTKYNEFMLPARRKIQPEESVDNTQQLKDSISELIKLDCTMNDQSETALLCDDCSKLLNAVIAKLESI